MRVACVSRVEAPCPVFSHTRKPWSRSVQQRLSVQEARLQSSRLSRPRRTLPQQGGTHAHQRMARNPKPLEKQARSGALAHTLAASQFSQKGQLKVQQLLGADIFEVHGVLTRGECKCLVTAAEAAGFQHQSSRGPRFGEALRDNGRLQLHDAALAQRLWQATGLRQIFEGMEVGGQSAMGLNSNIRLYRYAAGQHFGKHVDESVEASPGRWTKYTLLMYLSDAADGLLGGETAFFGHRGKKVACVTPVAGKALLHLHGDDCLEHEGMAVVRGTKYILRSDVVFV